MKLFDDIYIGKFGNSQLTLPVQIAAYRRSQLRAANMSNIESERKLGLKVLMGIRNTRYAQRKDALAELDASAFAKKAVNDGKEVNDDDNDGENDDDDDGEQYAQAGLQQEGWSSMNSRRKFARGNAKRLSAAGKGMIITLESQHARRLSQGSSDIRRLSNFTATGRNDPAHHRRLTYASLLERRVGSTSFVGTV